MREGDLEAYVAGLERHLTRRRGREHVLSPRDFALARRWHAARIPLAEVLAALDDAFAAGHDVSSLAFCRKAVEARRTPP